MAKNKVRYGLSRLYRAAVQRSNDDTVSYGNLVRMPGAVSISFSTEGSDPTDFYADDSVYYTIEGTNGGYTAELVVARVSDEDRVALLGEHVAENGVQYETTEDKPPEYAYIMEMQGNFKPIAFCFFCGKASRIALNANTKGESVEVDTDTISIRFTGIDLEDADGEIKKFIQGHIEKTDTNEAMYKKFFEEVPVPSLEATAEVQTLKADAQTATPTSTKANSSSK